MSRNALGYLAAGLAGAALALAAASQVPPQWLGHAREPAPSAIDIGFTQSMAVHHRQAIGMAKLMLDGRPTPLAGLASAIADSQLAELGEMHGWLRLWNQPFAPLKNDMVWMLTGRAPLNDELKQYLLDCRNSPTGMSGLATDAEVNRLRQLQGTTRDEHFLSLMIAHHQGGVPMARFAAVEANLQPVRQLAARIVLEQSREMAHMQRIQQALAAAKIESRKHH